MLLGTKGTWATNVILLVVRVFFAFPFIPPFILALATAAAATIAYVTVFFITLISTFMVVLTIRCRLRAMTTGDAIQHSRKELVAALCHFLHLVNVDQFLLVVVAAAFLLLAFDIEATTRTITLLVLVSRRLLRVL